MREIPVHPEETDEHALGEAMLAHDTHGCGPAGAREVDLAVFPDVEKAVPFHTGNRLRDRRTALGEALCYAGAQRRNPFLLQLEDGSQVHLSGVNKFAHGCLPKTTSPIVASPHAGGVVTVGSAALPRRRKCNTWAMVGLAVVSLKGGVGKTTVALGLAGAARDAGLRVLVVDLDPQANATAGLNPGKVEFTSGDVLADGREGVAFDAIIPSGWGGVDLIPAERSLEHRNASQTAGSALRLRRALRPVSEEYDLVLLDCPPSLGEITRNALAAAMQALVVTEPSFFALLGAEQALEAVSVIRDSANLRLRVAGIVVNRMRRTLAEHSFRWNEVAQAYPDLLLAPAVPERAVIQRAQGAGVPVQDLDRGGRGEVAGVFESLLNQTLDRTGSRRPQGV